MPAMFVLWMFTCMTSSMKDGVDTGKPELSCGRPVPVFTFQSRALCEAARASFGRVVAADDRQVDAYWAPDTRTTTLQCHAWVATK